MNQLAINPTVPASVTSTKSPLSTTFDFFAAMVASVENSRRRHQASMQLAHVEARTLRDAGISEAQRFLEVNKPFE
jgi:uncharacterized protein YjiS (DUF1127 family)